MVAAVAAAVTCWNSPLSSVVGVVKGSKDAWGIYKHILKCVASAVSQMVTSPLAREQMPHLQTKLNNRLLSTSSSFLPPALFSSMTAVMVKRMDRIMPHSFNDIGVPAGLDVSKTAEWILSSSNKSAPSNAPLPAELAALLCSEVDSTSMHLLSSLDSIPVPIKSSGETCFPLLGTEVIVVSVGLIFAGWIKRISSMCEAFSLASYRASSKGGV